jgi:hypothetical protein
MVELKEDLLKRVGDSPRVKKLTPKTRKKVSARVARDAPRPRDLESPREEDVTDEEMEDDEAAESEAMFADDAAEMNASPSSGSEVPESTPETTIDPRPRAEGLNVGTVTNPALTANPGRKEIKGPPKAKGDVAGRLDRWFGTDMNERIKTKDRLAEFCSGIDELIEKTMDEQNPNQVLSRVTADLKAFLMTIVITHMGGCHSPTPAADVTGKGPQPAKPIQKQIVPKAVRLPPATPRHAPNAQRAHTLIPQQRETAPIPPMTAPEGATGGNPSSATSKSYAGVARIPVPRGLPERPAQPLTKRKPARTSRVFVRLPEDSPLRAAHSLYIVKTVNSVLPPGKGVEYTSPVRTGIALTPKAGTTPDDLLQHKERISKSLGDGVVERDENWVVVKIHDLPTQMIALNDDNQLTSREVSIEEDIFPESAKAFDATPETGCWVQKREGSLTSSVRLTFKEENMKNNPKSGVIMGTRLKVEYPGARGVRPPQCRKCWGLHRLDTCRAEPRCRMCGDSNHKTTEHPSETPSKCINCEGPHAADSPSCPKTAPAAKKLHRTKKASNTC